jgi:hypothetical protein
MLGGQTLSLSMRDHGGVPPFGSGSFIAEIKGRERVTDTDPFLPMNVDSLNAYAYTEHSAY